MSSNKKRYAVKNKQHHENYLSKTLSSFQRGLNNGSKANCDIWAWETGNQLVKARHMHNTAIQQYCNQIFTINNLFQKSRAIEVSTSNELAYINNQPEQQVDFDINVLTGECKFDIRKLHATHLLHVPTFTAEYYQRLESSFKEKETLFESLKVDGEKQTSIDGFPSTYNITFGFEPRKQHWVSKEFEFASVEFSNKTSTLSPNETNSVFGHWLSEDLRHQISSKYGDSPFHHFFVTQALWAIHQCTNSKIYSLPPLEFGFNRLPDNVKKTMSSSVNIECGHGIIRQNVHHYEVHINYSVSGVNWDALNKRVGELAKTFGKTRHMVKSLVLTIKVMTYTYRPTELNKTSTIKPESLEYDVKSFETCPEEIFLHECISLSGQYMIDGMNASKSLQVINNFIIVMSNKGMDNDYSMVDFRRKIQTQIFGYSFPLQTCISGNSYLFQSEIPLLVPIYSVMKAIGILIRKGNSHPTSFELSPSDKNQQRNNSSMIKSLQRLISPMEPTYHWTSFTKPYFSCLVLAENSDSVHEDVQATNVFFMKNYGNPTMQKGWTLPWDSLNAPAPEINKLLELNIQRRVKLIQAAETSKQAQGNSRRASGKSKQASGILNPNLNVPLDDSELDEQTRADLDEIMFLASQPSVFDNEIYMW